MIGKYIRILIIYISIIKENNMEITETFYAKTREEWRAWLEENFDKKKEIWLIYYKKHTGKPNVSYDESVEEALCFGWIDGILKRIDDERYTRRFTPRRKGSVWAPSNVKRVADMIKEGKMTDAGLAIIPKAVLEGKAMGYTPVIPDDIPVPEDLEKVLAMNEKARDTWDSFASSHRKQYLYWINDAKGDDTKARRISKLVKMLEAGEKRLM